MIRETILEKVNEFKRTAVNVKVGSSIREPRYAYKKICCLHQLPTFAASAIQGNHALRYLT